MLDAEAEKLNAGMFAGKADAAKKGKFILDPMIGSSPLHVGFTASVSGEDVFLVDKPADVAMTSAGGSTPLTAVGGQVKIEAPQGTPGRDSRGFAWRSPRWSGI